MPVMLNSRVSAVILSRGSTWNPQPWEPPYTLPDTGNAWPTATASCVFYDTSGTTLATVSGTVTAGGIAFNAAPAVVDLIPNGANFELFLTVSGSPYQIRYGKVIRREAQFTTAPESVTSPLEFTDSWPTVGIRSTWAGIYGTVAIHDNSGVSLPNGASCVTLPSTPLDAAMRWYKPLGGDTVSAKVSLLNQHTYYALGYSKARVILCGSASFSSYLGVEFAASADGGGVHSDLIHFFTGSGITVAYQGSPVTSVVADGDDYTVHYDDATKTISVYKGTSTSPLGSWADSTHIVPHGPGYRYVGLAWNESASTDGMQVTSWQAIDAL